MDSKERARLRALANGLETVLQIGKDGIGENLIRQADITLEARELIKGRVLDGCIDYTARTAADALAEATNSEVIQVIGSKFVLYRKRQEEKKQAEKARPNDKKRRPRENARRQDDKRRPVSGGARRPTNGAAKFGKRPEGGATQYGKRPTRTGGPNPRKDGHTVGRNPHKDGAYRGGQNPRKDGAPYRGARNPRNGGGNRK